MFRFRKGRFRSRLSKASGKTALMALMQIKPVGARRACPPS